MRCRSADLGPVPGVTVEDMGHKMGMNGVDNAKLTFDNVRVPRSAKGYMSKISLLEDLPCCSLSKICSKNQGLKT